MKPISIFVAVVALTGLVYGQAFDVASIRESDPAAVGIRSTIEPNPGSLTTDQRGAGFKRVKGGAIDIGAFELK